MADDVDLVAFNRPDADQLIKLIGVAGSTPRQGKVDLYDATRLVLAYTSGGATARSGSTVGTGTADVKYLSGTSITDASSSVTFYNLAADPVGSSRYVLLLRLGNKFICVWEECT